MIQNLIFGILFFNNISGIQLFCICQLVPVDIIGVFFNFRFSSWQSQSQQNLAKKITHFTIQFYSKHLTHFANPNSLYIENNTLPQHGQKPFWLYKFSSKHVSVWCQKKHLYCTISWLPTNAFLKQFESKCLYLFVYLRRKKFCSRDAVRFYLVGVGWGDAE